MKKILLIGINARYSHPAMALYYLKRYVKDMPWDAKIIEFTIRTPLDEIVQSIKQESPDCVAFSVYIWNSGIVHKILAEFDNELQRPFIILGGPDAGYNAPDWTSRHSSIDYIISGHGEEAFRTLLLSNLKFNEKIISIKNPEFSQIPFPYTDEDIQSFANRKLYYESSRGCLFNCAYCLSSRRDQNIEFKDIDLVKKELDLLMKHKPAIIKFIDRTFNADIMRTKAIWEHIINSYPDSGTRFHFEIHPSLITENEFAVLKSVPEGLFQFEIGIQSTCSAALRAVNRTTSWEKIKPVIERIIAPGNIHVHVDLIAGLPLEDYANLEKSFNDVYALKADHFQFGYLKLLPGTELYDRKADTGIFSEDNPYDVIETKWLSAESVALVKVISRIVDAVYNSARFRTALENLIPLYPSPFYFFEGLARLCVKESMPAGLTWEYCATLIMKLNPTLMIKDALYWDYFLTSKSNRYPDILRSSAILQKRKELLVRLRNGFRIESVPDMDETILKKSKFFTAETEEFMEKYLNGKRCAVLKPDGRLVIIE